ncbi:MAG: SirB2 family protein [Proteobacteria bacterium]|nr:SirB2 family protein [Pseudomonadota bacterium]
MIEFYEQIKLVHVTAVLMSGSLFALRGLFLNLGYDWVMAAPIRWASYTIDTVLLTAALMLTTIIQQYPFVDMWLTVKVILLVVYIVLGFFSFWKARTKTVRVCCWLAALVVFGFIISVALAHDPLGILAM